MGLTYIKGEVKGSPVKDIRVRFLVDSGASYTLLPESVWKALKLKPKRTMTFSLADGTTIDRDISECLIKLPQGERVIPPLFLACRATNRCLGRSRSKFLV